MRIQNLTEYNKGEAGQGLSQSFLHSLREQAEFLTHFFRDQKPVNIYQTHMDSDKYFLIEYLDRTIGYLWCKHVNRNIYQVKLSYIVPEFRGQGLGTESYIQIMRNAGVRFIHDTQLSDEAEQIWRNKLPSANLIKGIYDRQLDQVYQLSQVGDQTVDGTTIISPHEHTSDPVMDPDGDQQRFFWITESKWGVAAHKLLEAHKLYHELGHALFESDSHMWHRANQSLRVIVSHEGF